MGTSTITAGGLADVRLVAGEAIAATVSKFEGGEDAGAASVELTRRSLLVEEWIGALS